MASSQKPDKYAKSTLVFPVATLTRVRMKNFFRNQNISPDRYGKLGLSSIVYLQNEVSNAETAL